MAPLCGHKPHPFFWAHSNAFWSHIAVKEWRVVWKHLLFILFPNTYFLTGEGLDKTRAKAGTRGAQLKSHC